MRTVTEKPYIDADAEAERHDLQSLTDHKVTSWTRPELEPLATRLARSTEVESCRNLTLEMLDELRASWPCLVQQNVRMGRTFPAPEQSGCDVQTLAIAADFLVVSWNGVFLIWSWPDRFVADAVPEVLRARTQLQEDLGEEWPGTVEAVFHFPREETGWSRNLGVDEETGEPYDIVMVSGRIDQMLIGWEPHGGAGIDPQWLRWLAQASEPRWWEQAATRKRPPKSEIPADEQC